VQFGGRPFNPPWRTNGELIERQKLEHRLRELDREQALNEALLHATTAEEKRRVRRKFEAEAKADDRVLDRELMNAKRFIEQKLTSMNKFYVQVAGSMLVSGSVEDAVGVESLVSQTVNRSGQRTVASPRFGVESGVFPTWLKVRAGTYMEPTRFDGSTPRVHATAGLDLKLLVWNVFGFWPNDYMWRLGLGGDAARNYYTWGVTIAGWYPRHTSPEKVPNFASDLAPVEPK
jgi:hypothetical protein